MPNYAKRNSLSWFLRRVGQEVILNNALDLFNPPIKVVDSRLAKALHAHQDKGHRYTTKTK